MAAAFLNDSSKEPVLTLRIGKDLDSPTVQIGKILSNYKQVASYNWLGTPSKPIIVVPGAPKKLIPWHGGQLKCDSGDLMADENHYMLPNFPMEPLFQAVKICNESLDDEKDCVKFQHFDIVSDRNNLRKLFSAFAFCPGDKTAAGSFLIYVQRIGRLICLIRYQQNDKEASSERFHPTFGKNFEQVSTDSINDLSSGSFRQIVSYKFGNLNILLRFEVDCADFEKAVLSDSSSASSGSSSACANPEDNLAEIMENLHVSPKIKPEKLPGSDLEMIRFGKKRQYHLVELTTRFYSKYHPKMFPKHVWPQMYLSGTNDLVIGWHYKGNIQPGNVQRITCEEVLDKYGEFPETGLKRMHNFLSKLVEFVREKDDDSTWAIVWDVDNVGSVKVFEVDDVERSAVPEGLKRFVEKDY